MNASITSPLRPVVAAAAAAAAPKPNDRIVIVGAGPAGMAAAIELAQNHVPSIVLEKRTGPATRENLFNVTPPMADRLAALDPSGGLSSLLVATDKMTSDVLGTPGVRNFAGGLVPDPQRSRGDMHALVESLSATGDNRRWAKVGIGDLENGLRELARTSHADMIELRTGAAVESIRQGGDWTEAVLKPAADGAAADAVRGALLIDATGGDLLGGPRTVYPEQAHWIGGRFAAPADGDTGTLRRFAVTDDAGGAATVSIKLPSTDRTMVWAQVTDDARGMADEDRATLLEHRAETLGVAGDMVDARHTAPVSVQLWTSQEPSRGRVLKIGDSVRAPYFPTSTGAAGAFVHDAPRAVDAILAVRGGMPVEQASSAFADAVRGANDELIAISRRALLADIGIPMEQAGEPTTVTRSTVPHGSGTNSAPASSRDASIPAAVRRDCRARTSSLVGSSTDQ